MRVLAAGSAKDDILNAGGSEEGGRNALAFITNADAGIRRPQAKGG